MNVSPPTMAGPRHSHYMNTLSKIATDIAYPVKNNARLAACVVYKNDIVSFGINEMKSHPFQAKWGTNKEAIFLHAEVSAIKNALKQITLKEFEKSTLYVCRVRYEDWTKQRLVFGLSKPCDGCIRCISTFNLRSVYYSLDDSGYQLL